MTLQDAIALAGPAAFGLVVGWVTYRTLRRNAAPVDLKDLAAVVGVVGGGAVTALFGEPALFGSYSIGLAAGFFAYFAAAARRHEKDLASLRQDLERLRSQAAQGAPAAADELKRAEAALRKAQAQSPSSWMGGERPAPDED